MQLHVIHTIIFYQTKFLMEIRTTVRYAVVSFTFQK